MPFEKGNKLSKGRPVGAVNRSTEQMKLSIARATNSVLDDLPKMLEEMKKKDPRSAIDLVIKLLEYNLPKQSRVEMRAEIDQRIHQISVNINKSGSDAPNN
jgi:hypothetical protein